MKLIEIKDFAGYYAGTDGNIYTTLKKGCRDRYDLSKRTEPKILNPRLLKGYNRVYLRRESSNAREDLYVHRIIALTFLENPENLPEVNHKNSIRNDNRPENLEWCSRIENIEHAMTEGSLTRDVDGKFISKNK